MLILLRNFLAKEDVLVSPIEEEETGSQRLAGVGYGGTVISRTVISLSRHAKDLLDQKAADLTITTEEDVAITEVGSELEPEERGVGDVLATDISIPLGIGLGDNVVGSSAQKEIP